MSSCEKGRKRVSLVFRELKTYPVNPVHQPRQMGRAKSEEQSERAEGFCFFSRGGRWQEALLPPVQKVEYDLGCIESAWCRWNMQHCHDNFVVVGTNS